MARVKLLEVSSAVRGYHYYRYTWNPLKDEGLLYERVEDNPCDIFALKVMNSNKEIRGHLPLKISRSSYFLILRGATWNCTVTDENYYRSLIVQGGLEILCKLRRSMVPTSHIY